MTSRAFGAGRALVGVHVELAQKEAAEDAGRVAGASAGLVVVAGLIASGLLLVDVAIVTEVMNRWQLALGQAALAVAGGHLVLAAPIALWARARLKQPVLTRTRGRMKETVDALKGT